MEEDLSLLSQVGKGVIPNAAMIHAARKRRELARNLGGSTCGSYISLNQTSDKSQECDEGGNDIDDDNSDEEATKVRQFGIRQDATKQMQVLSAMDNAESGSDEDRFEEQQIYKGAYLFPTTNTSESQSIIIEYEEPIQAPPAQVRASAKLESEIILTPISFESVQSQLKSQLSHLQAQRSSNNDTITKLKEDLVAAQNAIGEAESQSLSLSMRYQFYQEMRGYVKDLLLCLTEKVFQ